MPLLYTVLLWRSRKRILAVGRSSTTMGRPAVNFLYADYTRGGPPRTRSRVLVTRPLPDLQQAPYLTCSKPIA